MVSFCRIICGDKKYHGEHIINSILDSTLKMNTDLKNLLIVARYPIGGILSYIRYTYGNIKSGRYKISMIIPGDYEKEAEIIRNELVKHGINVYMAKGKNKNIALTREIIKYLLNNKINIVHSQGATCGILVSFANSFFRIPHINTLHETFEEIPTKGTIEKYKDKIIGYMLSRADIINTVTEDAENNLRKRFPTLERHKRKIITIHNGIDTAYFLENNNSWKSIREIEGIRNDSFVIGYLGRFMPEKGFRILVDAIEHIINSGTINKDIKVLALGNGAYIREYREYINGKGLNDRFVFPGFQTDVRWVLRQIDLLAIPSLREACPLVSAEGLVCGTPVVASKCIGLREVTHNTPAQMVEPGNPSALGGKIVEIMNNYQSIKNECVAFVPEAVNRFDAGRTSAKLEEIITNLLH